MNLTLKNGWGQQAQTSGFLPSRRCLYPWATALGSLLFIMPLARSNLHLFLYCGKLEQDGWVSSTLALSLVVKVALQAGGSLYHLWWGEHWICITRFQDKCSHEKNCWWESSSSFPSLPLNFAAAPAAAPCAKLHAVSVHLTMSLHTPPGPGLSRDSGTYLFCVSQVGLCRRQSLTKSA